MFSLVVEYLTDRLEQRPLLRSPRDALYSPFPNVLLRFRRVNAVKTHTTLLVHDRNPVPSRLHGRVRSSEMLENVKRPSHRRAASEHRKKSLLAGTRTSPEGCSRACQCDVVFIFVSIRSSTSINERNRMQRWSECQVANDRASQSRKSD